MSKPIEQTNLDVTVKTRKRSNSCPHVYGLLGGFGRCFADAVFIMKKESGDQNDNDFDNYTSKTEVEAEDIEIEKK